jgi:uncharacterized protein (DUF4415 family)
MTENRRVSQTDFAKFDAHIIGPEEYADIPEITDEMFACGVWMKNGKPLKRGRPKSASPKQQVTLRLDRDVLERFRAGGAGWQSRINEALRQAAGIAYGVFSESPERGIDPPHDKRRRSR